MNDKVIDTIKSGEVKMHSRSYFVARAILIIIFSVLLFLFIFFVTTFIIFALQLNGGLYAAGFGPLGWLVFLSALPWSLLLLSIVLVLLLWMLLRRYAIVYHQPFLYVLLLLVVVISLACFFLSASSIHNGIYRYVSRYPVPVMTGVYEFETAPASGVYRGQVVALATSSFILANAAGQTSTVFVLPGAVGELVDIGPGDYVLIFGRGVATATIDAAGVETIVDYR
jgi:hypothetical protein